MTNIRPGNILANVLACGLATAVFFFLLFFSFCFPLCSFKQFIPRAFELATCNMAYRKVMFWKCFRVKTAVSNTYARFIKLRTLNHDVKCL